MAHRAPSSSITYKWTYDVFLSFHGKDTRLGFTSHLHQALRQREIRVFLDDECIRTGENITPTLFSAIKESRTAIIVFSVNYANSTFCLRELAKILKYFKKESRLIYPVFYHVDPSELRNPRESYAEALAQLEERFKDKRHKVEKWRQALSQAADVKGCHLEPKIANEQECITRIVKEVATRINQEPLHVTNYPVGLVPRGKEVISYLEKSRDNDEDIWPENSYHSDTDSSSTQRVSHSQVATKYDVFLSSTGEDTRRTIANNLYNGVHNAGVRTFMDYNLRKGEQISQFLLKSEESYISIIIISKDFAFSTWCLEELVHILECKEKFGMVGIPLFYNEDPSNIHKQNDCFGKGFDVLRQRFKDKQEKLQGWRNALIPCTNLSGCDLNNDFNNIRSEFKLVEEIVKDTLSKSNYKSSSHLERLVGIACHVENI